MSTEVIGMMEGAYFVPRGALLSWLNEFLELEEPFTQITDVANAATHIQLFDALYPGTVPLHRVHFGAKLHWEMVNNYKILQAVFRKNGITKRIDIEKLTRCKNQDNLEFLQWMKRYFDLHYDGTPYAAAERRRKAMAIYKRNHCGGRRSAATRKTTRPVGTVSKAAVTSTVSTQKAKAKPKTRGRVGLQSLSAGTKSMHHTSTAARDVKENKKGALVSTGNGMSGKSSKVGSSPASSVALRKAKIQINRQKSEIEKLEQDLKSANHDRDFYFEKLRQLEELCDNEVRRRQVAAETPGGDKGRGDGVLLARLLAVLYADNSMEGSQEATLQVEEATENAVEDISF